MTEHAIDARIDALDVTLFDAIAGQSNAGDRRSWLALQRAVRRRGMPYAYLEIGSFRGGSMQSFVLDPSCVAIYSVDKRPSVAPDDRGRTVSYAENTTQSMLERLRRLSPSGAAKVHTFDGTAADIDPGEITTPPGLCFVDAEHTARAVLVDVEFVLRVCSPTAVVYFHDDVVVAAAIAGVIRNLRARDIAFQTAKLGGSTFAIGLGNSVLAEPDVKQLSRAGESFLRRQRVKLWLKRHAPAPLLRVYWSIRRR